MVSQYQSSPSAKADTSTSTSPLPSVAYLGPRSSYSHQAALECFDQAEHTFEPQGTIADIFTAVQTKSVTYGVVPFENSTNGSVVFTLDLFCDRTRSFRDTFVRGEACLDVHHCLLSSAASLKSVTRIYSHPQAFGQCENWLGVNARGVERIDVSSTSKAAQMVVGDAGAAAIASKVAADVHGLQILAGNIEDTADNTTRFFVLAAQPELRAPVSRGEGEADKTLLSFTIDHQVPGALCDSLKVFKDFELNLTSIASRPSRLLPWNYIFFVEFEGHSDTQEVKIALDELRKYCLNLRVLGSYKDMQRRKGQGYRDSKSKVAENGKTS
ncbi:PDT-domain-containing protein [Choiromyces venosus 120613-1]|uniref:prephenate dehydratase n=1 Tax=Choiromyces venosus 120613-1 TaxID=1336337 RepID=A0A3N4JY55_9PEZI|nr:PDT-domain-containing protein [Choiromyces venosus 120613-1]